MEATLISATISITSSTVVAVVAYLLAVRHFRKEALRVIRLLRDTTRLTPDREEVNDA